MSGNQGYRFCAAGFRRSDELRVFPPAKGLADPPWCHSDHLRLCSDETLNRSAANERHARHTHQTGNHKDCRFFRVLLAMLPTTPQAMAIFYRRRIFRSPLGSRNARRGAYMAYVSTERFTADTAVGEKDKSIWSMFSPHSCTAPTHSSPRASYRHRPVRGLCSSTLCP